MVLKTYVSYIHLELEILIYSYSSTLSAKYSEPKIIFKLEKNSKNVEGVLECNSTGYPKGQLRWFDVHNKEWTNSATMDSEKTKDGRIQLSSRLPLLRGSNFSFTCAVFNATGSRESNVTCPDRHSGIVGQQKGKWCKTFSSIFLE